MPVKVEYSISTSTATLIGHGVVTNKDCAIALDQALDKIRNDNAKFVLIDFSLVKSDPGKEHFFPIARHVEFETVTMRRAKWAIVTNENAQIMLLVMSQAATKGVWVAIFDEPAEALEWLHDGRPSPIWIRNN